MCTDVLFLTHQLKTLLHEKKFKSKEVRFIDIYSCGIKHYLHCISDMVYVCTVTPYIAFFLKFEEVFLIVAVKY